MEFLTLVDDIKKWLSDTEIRTFSPATDKEISDGEETLQVKFPVELKEYLTSSNGLLQLMINPQDNKLMPIEDLIYSTSQIVKETLAHYDYLSNINAPCLYKCIVFAGSGCGESFCYRFSGYAYDTSIYIYYPIDNKFLKVSSSFEEWVNGWFSGKISV